MQIYKIEKDNKNIITKFYIIVQYRASTLFQGEMYVPIEIGTDVSLSSQCITQSFILSCLILNDLLKLEKTECNNLCLLTCMIFYQNISLIRVPVETSAINWRIT